MDSLDSDSREGTVTWADDNEVGEPILYSQRWVQLGLVSLLALISDWVCFGNSAIPNTWEQITGVRSRHTDPPSTPADPST
eukprot:3674018-Pyramimonas_sp.AAC.1